jgi:hypothetical protein
VELRSSGAGGFSEDGEGLVGPDAERVGEYPLGCSITIRDCSAVFVDEVGLVVGVQQLLE